MISSALVHYWKKKQITQLVSNALPSSREYKINGKINPKKEGHNIHCSKGKRNKNVIEEIEKVVKEKWVKPVLIILICSGYCRFAQPISNSS